ncbi:isoprenylcysteine carboxylmethyltransferase family protein [Gillisia sp. M10.2A]|uniref:Isoprenylcysteine carboxylmethyltransferase family protein n=1 Tax=Gillisia lutea TaxID=2909668 RepID=A0ABS9EF56_9FLAO|nr:methyltransferase [Gillisia lutea]MCF4101428.1 isoprenylcysteine carboxylmethyltransferase family protein [Gillisia lutea]
MKLQNKDITYVGIQLMLFIGYFFEVHSLRFTLPSYLIWTCIAFLVLGLGLILAALVQINTRLSVFPSPKDNAILLTEGVFKIMRHPIYTGIIINLLAIALMMGSGFKLVISFLVLLLFHFKSNYEEEKLR